MRRIKYENNKYFAIGYSVIGIILLYLAKFVLIQNYLKVIQGICIGIGAILFIYGIGFLAKTLTDKNFESEEFKRNKEILVNDERNVLIKEKAGYMTVKTMNIAFFIFIILFGALTKERLSLILLGILIFVQGALFIGYSVYYGKKY